MLRHARRNATERHLLSNDAPFRGRVQNRPVCGREEYLTSGSELGARWGFARNVAPLGDIAQRTLPDRGPADGTEWADSIRMTRRSWSMTSRPLHPASRATRASSPHEVAHLRGTHASTAPSTAVIALARVAVALPGVSCCVNSMQTQRGSKRRRTYGAQKGPSWRTYDAV